MQKSQGNSQSNTPYNAQEFATNMTKAGQIWQQILQLLSKHQGNDMGIGHADPLQISQSFMQLGLHMASNPSKMMQTQMGMMQDYMQLWQSSMQRMLGKDAPALHPEASKDRRFRDDAWESSTFFDYMKESYLIMGEWMQKAVDTVDGLDEHTMRKLRFYTQQYVDAMAPTNFMLTNPAVMRETMESNAENLVHGLENMLHDLERGDGKLRISMVDEDAFSFGDNIACTPGKVVYQNDLMQLIQYAPSTEKVYKTPVLVIPAWINKYYILDLQPENSFVKWLVDQGHTVFIISWANPDASLAHKTFADYMLEGPLAALDAIEQATREHEVNTVGYCLGGTLLSITQAYLQAHDNASRIKSATYLTTMVDFTDAGDLSVFIDKAQLDALDQRMQQSGYLEADDMANTFSMLRSNDLIWSFVVNNYLLGRDPLPFDLLYWNSDATRMPARMHSFYLRNMYLNNQLIKPGGIELDNTPINITKLTTPAYILSTKEDHIAPWTSTYLATQIYDGPTRFTLAESGHVAGVINAPSRNKYGFWSLDKNPPKADSWLDEAEKQEGSWWPHWEAWLREYAGSKVKARTPGAGKLKAIEDAPGSYVTVRG